MEVLLDGLDLLESLLAWIIHASDKRNHISVSLAIRCVHLLVADLRNGTCGFKLVHLGATRFLASVAIPGLHQKLDK